MPDCNKVVVEVDQKGIVMKTSNILILVSLSTFICFLGCSSTENQRETVLTENSEMADQEELHSADSVQKVTFIELGSDECIPCKMMKHVMRAIEEEFGDQVQVVFHDVWEDQAPAEQYKIRMIPTQVFLDESGEEFFRHEGYFPKEEVETLLLNRGLTLLKTVEIEKYEEK